MKKSIVSKLLTVTIVASMLVGCGTANETAPAMATEANNDYSAPDVVYEEPACEAAPAYEEAAPATEDAGAAPAQKVASVKATEAANTYAEVEEAYVDGYYDEYYEPYMDDGETYSSLNETGFTSVAKNPLSTFAADVDTASYSNFRRFVTYGYRLGDFPADALRSEEMINYFTYDYAKPKKGEIFGVDAQISDCPWNEEAKLMILGVNTKEMSEAKRPNSNIVFLVDVSGSMSDYNKLPLIQQSMDMLMDQFDEDDRISIVTYASGVEVKLDGVSGDKKSKIMRAFNKLNASGSTNGGDGIKLAYKVAEENFIEGGVNRIIICSDGDFNVGLTSESELEDLITEKKESGVFLSVLGFGMYNYSDTTMETLADCGNGNYAYIDTLAEAKKVLVDEMMKNFVAVAKDVKLQVEFNPALVDSYRLVGYENRALAAEDFTDDTKDGGELGAGHQVTVVYEIIMAEDAKTTSDLKYQDTTVSKKGEAKDEYCTLSIAYKDIDKDTSKYLDFPINAKNYTKNPSDNFVFASSVAEASLALRDSDYLVDVTPEEAVEDIIDNLEDMDLDEYQEEFVDLLSATLDGTGYEYNYYYAY